AGGFSQLALHVSINGVPRPPLPLRAEIGAGVHPVDVALELGPLQLKPDDSVSYQLVGELKRPAPSAKGDAATPGPAASAPRTRPAGVTLDLGVLDPR